MARLKRVFFTKISALGQNKKTLHNVQRFFMPVILLQCVEVRSPTSVR